MPGLEWLALICRGQPQSVSFLGGEASTIAGHADDLNARRRSKLISREQIGEIDGGPLRLGVPAAGAVKPGHNGPGPRRKIGYRESSAGNIDPLVCR